MVSYAHSEWPIAVRLWAGDGWGGHAEGDALSGIEHAEGSARDDRLEGDDGGNHLLGLAGDDVLLGRSGDDTLQGGTGRDMLHGQAGSDVLLGGAGADVFVFVDGHGQDTIGDFAEDDVIDLRGISSLNDFDDLSNGPATDGSDGVWIDHGEGAILIENMVLANLDLTDFLF